MIHNDSHVVMSHQLNKLQGIHTQCLNNKNKAC